MTEAELHAARSRPLRSRKTPVAEETPPDDVHLPCAKTELLRHHDLVTRTKLAQRRESFRREDLVVRSRTELGTTVPTRLVHTHGQALIGRTVVEPARDRPRLDHPGGEVGGEYFHRPTLIHENADPLLGAVGQRSACS